MERTVFSWWFAKRLAFLAAATVIFGCILGVVLAHAEKGGDSPEWVIPSAMAIRRVGSTIGSQNAPVLFSNLDCTPVTYRMVADSAMQAGCFTETAFGMLDSDSYVIIFNGTDEGLPLLPYTAHQILAPWPKAMDLVALEPVSTGGAFISLYKNPLSDIQDKRNLLGQLTAKQLSVPPDLIVKDPSGSPLVINPQTLAFSEGGSWLVAETLSGSFVRVNLATLAITAFAPSYGSQGSPALLKSRVAVSESGRFIAIANDAATEFKVYDLGVCDGIVRNLTPQDCKSYDYRPFAGQRIPGLRSIRQVRFVNDGLLSFEAVSTNPDNSGSYELAPASSIKSLTDYLGLGDSYTSGEGAFDYLTGTDGPDNLCHLSRNSYPLLLTHDLFGGSGGHSVACSGAVINDIGNTTDSYHGQVRGGMSLQGLEQTEPPVLESIETDFIPGYVAQQRFVKHWQPEITTVSIGGNDIGFGDLLQNCVEPHVSLHPSVNTCYSTYEDRLEVARLIDRTVPRWTTLFNQLIREAPDTRLYVIGYPQVAYDKGNCGLNVQLNKSELEFAAETIDYLNADIRKAALAARVSYIDIGQALKGHRLCEAAGYDVAVNGLTAGKDAGPLGVGILGKESYHPNALGHELIEQAILKQAQNFSEPDPVDTDSGRDGDAAVLAPLLDAPKTGRTVYTLVPDDGLTSGLGKRGQAMTVQIEGANDGLRPNTAYAVRLNGSGGKILGSITSNDSGNASGKVTIPIDTTPGGHTIDIISENANGEPTDVTQPIYVQANDSDSDGDGIDDITDSCPEAINSGQDKDLDGVDDICDSVIGSYTSPGGTTNNTSSSNSTRGYALPSQGRVLGTTTVNPLKSAAYISRQHAVRRAGLRFLPPIRGKVYWPLWPLVVVLALVFILKKYIKKRGFRLQ